MNSAHYPMDGPWQSSYKAYFVVSS